MARATPGGNGRGRSGLWDTTGTVLPGVAIGPTDDTGTLIRRRTDERPRQ